MSTKPRTLFEKIWDSHVVYDEPGRQTILYIDLHLVHEVTSPQAFEGLRLTGRKIRRPELTLSTVDHNVPTTDRSLPILDPISKQQIDTLRNNCKEFGITLYDIHDPRQGIVHVIGPEQGYTQPGMTIVCGDSHTSTHGAFGALAFGIGTSEVEHVLATQTLLQKPARTLLVQVNGQLARGTTAKDLILGVIAQIGTAGATGHVIEYAGNTISELDMAGRMTVCNMSIEAGARAGLIAPDATTFAYLEGRPLAPVGKEFEAAKACWLALRSDPGARYDKTIVVNAATIAPMVTWGTTPEAVIPIDGVVPNPAAASEPGKSTQMWAMLEYLGLEPGRPLNGLSVDAVFLGSCTNSRIEDLRAAAAVIGDGRVADHVRALVVPGSGQVKAQAEREGLDRLFRRAGFEWREPGCSMCLGMNPDRLKPGERCASTSNRNFEGRQGPGGRTHLMSPAMAAAAAISGHIVDIRKL